MSPERTKEFPLAFLDIGVSCRQHNYFVCFLLPLLDRVLAVGMKLVTGVWPEGHRVQPVSSSLGSRLIVIHVCQLLLLWARATLA